MYAQLLIDLFKYLAPFLRNVELTKPMQILYKVKKISANRCYFQPKLSESRGVLVAKQHLLFFYNLYLRVKCKSGAGQKQAAFPD